MSERLDSLAANIELFGKENSHMKDELGHIKLRIQDSEARTSNLENDGQTSKENIDKIVQSLQSINHQIASIESSSSANWESIEGKLAGHQSDLANISIEFSNQKNVWGNLDREFEHLKEINSDFMNNLDLQKNEIQKLQENQKGNEKGFEELHQFQARIHTELSDMHVHVDNIQVKLEDMDKDQTESKTSLEMQDKKINKLAGDLQQLDSRHVEIAEKVNEIHMFATNLDIHIRTVEEKTERKINLDVENISQKLSLLEVCCGTLEGKIDTLDNKGDGLLKMFQKENIELGNKITNLGETSQELSDKLNGFESIQSKKFKILDDLVQSCSDKIGNLEEASMKHFEHAQYLDSLNQRVIQLDEARQQSVAQARDEVDGTFTQYKHQLSETQSELENRILEVEKQLKTAEKQADKAAEDLKKQIDELENKNKMSDQFIENLKKDLQASEGLISSLNISLQQKLQEINDRTNEQHKKIQDLENENRTNIERLVSIQETSMIEKVNYIEALSEKVNKIDEERQESEQKLNLQNGDLIRKNADAIQDLAKELDGKLTSLEQVRKDEFQNLSLQAENLRVQISLLLNEQQKQVDELEAIKHSQGANAATLLLAVENNSKTLELKLKEKALEIDDDLRQLDEKIANTIQCLKENNLGEIKELREILTDEVSKTREHVDEQVKEAEHHVENLRELNGKLIDQVKEKMKSHEDEQAKISEDLKSNNNKQMESLKDSFSDQIQILINIKDEHTESISSISSTIFAMKENLTKASEDIGHISTKIVMLEQGQEIQDNKLAQLEISSSELMKSSADLKTEIDSAIGLLRDSQLKSGQSLKEEVLDLVKDQGNCCISNADKLNVFIMNLSEQMNKVEQTLPESLMQQAERVDSKLHELEVKDNERFSLIEERIQTNSLNITANVNLIDKQTKEFGAVFTTRDELNEKVCWLQAALDTMKGQVEVLEKQGFINNESFRAEQDAERKKLDEIKRHISELDDAVTLLTPDIKNINERVFHIEEKQFSSKFDDITAQVSDIRESLNVNNSYVKDRYEQLIDDHSKLEVIVNDVKTHVEHIQVMSNTEIKQIQDQLHGLITQADHFEIKIKESNEKNAQQNLDNIMLIKAEQEKLISLAKDDIKSVEGNQEELLARVTDVEETVSPLQNQIDWIKSVLEEKVKGLENTDKDNKAELMTSLQGIEKQIFNMEGGIGQNGEQMKIIVELDEKIAHITRELKRTFQHEISTSTFVLQENLDVLKKDYEDVKQRKAEDDGKLSQAVEKLKQQLENMHSESQAFTKDLQEKISKAENEVNMKCNALEQVVQLNEEKLSKVESNGVVALEKLISLEEATLQHAEKAQYIEVLSARVSQVDEMRQKSEAKAQEDVSAVINGNMEKIQQLQDQLNAEVSNTQGIFQGLKNDVVQSKHDLEDMKAEKLNFQDDLAKYHEMMELKLKEIDIVAKDNVKTLRSLEADVLKVDTVAREGILETQSEINKIKDEMSFSLTNVANDLRSKIETLTVSTAETMNNKHTELLNFCTNIQEEMRANDKEHRDAVTDMKNANLDSIAAIQNDYDTKLKGIMESCGKQASSIDLATTFVNSSQEIFNTLTMGNAQQEEQIKALENQFQLLDKKLESLESADLFLQEAHRMLTDKTTHVESEARKMEESLSSLLRDQEEEINLKLKVQVASLLKDVTELTTDKVKIYERIDTVKERALENVEKIKGLEEGNLESYKSIQTYLDNKLQEMKEEFETSTEKVENKIENNKLHIAVNETNIKENTEKILGIQGDIGELSNKCTQLMNSNIISNVETLQSELNIQVGYLQNSIETMNNKLNTEFGNLAPQVQKNKDLLGELQKISEEKSIQLSSLATSIEKLREDNSTIIDELHNAEEKFDDLDNQIIGIGEKVAMLDATNQETVNKIQDITVLTSNIQINVKAQEERFEQKKSVDMEEFATQIADLRQENSKIELYIEGMTLDKKNVMDQLIHIESQINNEKTSQKAENASLNVKLDSYMTNLNALENEFNKLIRDSKINEESYKALAQRINDLEMLEEKLKQLDDLHQKDRERQSNNFDGKWLTVDSKIQKLQEDVDKKFELFLAAEMKDLGEILKKEIESLKIETENKSKQLAEVEHGTKLLISRVDSGEKDFNTKQNMLTDHISSLITRLEAVENNSEDHLQKLISLEEATFMHAEKAKYVESLNEKISRIDEIRQQSESKSREEFENTVVSNVQAIEALKTAMNERINKLVDDIQGDYSSLKHDIETRISNSNESMRSNINGDLESKIIAIYSKIEEHRSLIEKTHSSITMVREKVAQNESQQFGIQDSWSKEYDNKMEALRREIDSKFQDLFIAASEHSNVLAQNSIYISQLNESNTTLSARVASNEQEVANTKVRKVLIYFYFSLIILDLVNYV